MKERNYPFSFATEASVDLAQDPEMMQMMVECNFGSVFLGIETPDTDSLALTKKFQNNRDPLSESVINIAKAGIRVMAGFIIGFDGEKKEQAIALSSLSKKLLYLQRYSVCCKLCQIRVYGIA